MYLSHIIIKYSTLFDFFNEDGHDSDTSIIADGVARSGYMMLTVRVCFRDQLAETFDLIENVDVLDSQDTTNLALLTRSDLGVTFTKLHCWRLTQYSKCVFMDADTLVRTFGFLQFLQLQ